MDDAFFQKCGRSWMGDQDSRSGLAIQHSEFWTFLIRLEDERCRTPRENLKAFGAASTRLVALR
jgi:hypothetical protein